MEIFKIITIEKASKFGQHYTEANLDIFNKTLMKTRMIKTSEIEEIIPLSDFDIENYKEEEHEEIEKVIKDYLYTYFYIKIKTPIKSNNGKDSFLILVKGDIIEFMKLLHTGGHLNHKN
jgi:hypothetical protein